MPRRRRCNGGRPQKHAQRRRHIDKPRLQTDRAHNAAAGKADADGSAQQCRRRRRSMHRHHAVCQSQIRRGKAGRGAQFGVGGSVVVMRRRQCRAPANVNDNARRQHRQHTLVGVHNDNRQQRRRRRCLRMVVVCDNGQRVDSRHCRLNVKVAVVHAPGGVDAETILRTGAQITAARRNPRNDINPILARRVFDDRH